MTTVTFVPKSTMPPEDKFVPYSYDTNELPQLTDIINLTIEGVGTKTYYVEKRTFFVKENRWEIVLDNGLFHSKR